MPSPRNTFRERLGYYIMGVAIGCMGLGMAKLALMMQKRAAHAANPPAQQFPEAP